MHDRPSGIFLEKSYGEAKVSPMRRARISNEADSGIVAIYLALQANDFFLINLCRSKAVSLGVRKRMYPMRENAILVANMLKTKG